MRKTIMLAGIMLALALALALAPAGCGNDADQPPPVAAPTQQPSPTPATYDSIHALRQGVEGTGNVCTVWEIVGGVDPVEAICTSEMHLFTFDAEHIVQGYVDDLAAFPVQVLGRSEYWLVGLNWAVRCGEDRDTCEDLEATLGGQLRIYEP